MGRDFGELRILRLGCADFFQLDEPIQNRVALQRRSFRISQWRKAIRAPDQSGQGRRLRQVQFRRVLSEVGKRRGLHAVTAGPEINPVHVKLEDLLLGEILLDPQRYHRFQNFSAQGSAAERETIAGELLSNTARAFLGRAAHDVAHQRARDPAPVDSAVLEEPRVFAGQQGVDEKRRYFVERDLHPICARETAVNFSVHVEDGVPLWHVADFFQLVGLRPDRVEKENAENQNDRQPQKPELPRETDPGPALFPSRRAGEQFHRQKVKSLSGQICLTASPR